MIVSSFVIEYDWDEKKMGEKIMTIRQVTAASEKASISRSILEALQDWFEVDDSREYYIRESKSWPFFAAFEGDTPAGFLCLKETGKQTVELAVMGVLKAYHRHGLGRQLFEAAAAYARNSGYQFMQVKTVKEGMYPDYDATNRFYQSLGFCELEVFPELWDKDNPCQVYIMNLQKTDPGLDLLLRRRSYRGKYMPVPVPREDLKTIMDAGLAAPSGCNKQTTSLIAVDDPAVLEKLHQVIDPPAGATAPAMICVLTQRIFAYRDRCFSVQDYSAAIENMLLAAVALGYQSCWFEGHITDEDRIGRKMADLLGVPDDYDLVCFLPVGIAESEPGAPRKKSFDERAWFNGFPGRD